MPAKDTLTSPSGLDVDELLRELEVPFSPEQVQWRVTNTTNDKKRGQVVPYADPRAYTDRLNALLSPQGWTREYKVETMSNITRVKKGESLLSGKVLVICTVTIFGLWSHSGTGEEWADDDNSVTSADAQAFKRACSCFGLGRYFYDVPAIWVDLDQNRQPAKTPVLSAWVYRKTGARVCAREPEIAMESPERRCKARARRKETMAVGKRQLVGVMVTTARAVTVQLKSLMAHLRRIPTMSSISASSEWKKRLVRLSTAISCGSTVELITQH